MSDISPAIGDHIRRLRIDRGLSQQELADRVGVRQTAISGLENGAFQPRVDTLQRLASALGVSTSVLLESQEVLQ